jgi:hypothetical protein
LCASVFDDSSPETQRRYRLGDLDRIFLVEVSAPAGVPDRNMLNVVPRTFAARQYPKAITFFPWSSKSSFLHQNL